MTCWASCVTTSISDAGLSRMDLGRNTSFPMVVAKRVMKSSPLGSPGENADPTSIPKATAFMRVEVSLSWTVNPNSDDKKS